MTGVSLSRLGTGDPFVDHRGEKTPVCHSLVVVFVSTEAAAAQQREQDNQQKGDQGSCRNHTHPLVGL